jgi:hypothetical protein
MAVVCVVGSGSLTMYVGIDIAKETLTCSLLESPQKLYFFGETVANNEAGNLSFYHGKHRRLW